jgi:hypothetical protein
VDYGSMSPACVLMASTSEGWKLAVELLMAAAWSMWLLFERTMAQPFNNIDAMSLDPDLGVVAGSFCRSLAVAQGMRSSLAYRHGDMIKRKLVLLGGWQANLR